MAERMKYWQDKGGKLKNVFERVMRKHFKELLEAEFLYTFRNKDKHDDEGRVIIAEARRVGARERDIYGPDFEICVHADTWQSAREDEKFRIAFHELNHCRIEVDEDGHAKRDDDDRVITKIMPHDVYIKSFRKEIELFGFTKEDEELAEFIAEVLKGASSHKRRKDFSEDLDNVKSGKKKKKDKSEKEAMSSKTSKKALKEGKKELKEFKVSRETRQPKGKKDKKPKSKRSKQLYLD